MAQPTNDLPLNTYGPAEESSSGQDLPFSAYGPAPTDASQMSVSATSNLPPETWIDKAYDVITGPGSPFASPVENAKFTARTGIPTSPFEEGLHSAFGQAAVSVPAKIGAYFQNFGALHQTTNKTFSPEQVAAAKKLGIPLPTEHLNPNITGLLPNTVSTLDIGTEGYNKIFDDAARSAGVDPAAIQRTIDAGERGDLSTANLANAIAQKSLISQSIKALANPSLANTKVYEETQRAASSLNTLKDPKASPEDKKRATYNLLILKAENEGFTDSLKGMYEEFKKSPSQVARSLLFSMGETPELAAVGGAGDLGKALFGAKTAQAASLAGRVAERGVEDIAKARLLETMGDETSGISKLQKAQRLAKTASRLQKMQTAGNIAGEAGAGATINSAASAMGQYGDRGYVSPGQTAAAGVAGAAFGGMHSIMHSTGLPLIDDLRQRMMPGKKTGETGPSPTEEAPKTPAGTPLHPDTPINDTGKPPLTGGVDASGRHTHLHEDIPESMDIPGKDGKTVSVPVKQLINYHETVEFPLMHLSEPMTPEAISEIEQRIGKPLPEITKQKLLRGEKLPYTNPDNPEDPGAHEIATWAENYAAENLYGVDGDTYQKHLEPIIKRIDSSAKKSPGEGVPQNLDTKPYDDIGETDSLGGKGARPAESGVPPGAPEGSDNQAAGHNTLPQVTDEKLPQNLRGAKPTYYNGTKGFGLDFANDFDKAAYILRNPKKLSKHDAAYMAWAQKVSGMTPEAIRAHGQRVASTIKGISKSAEPKTRIKVGAHSQSGAVDRRLLATMGAVGLGAGAAYALSPADRRHELASAGGLAGLLASLTMLGDSVPARGFGAREAGVFAGPMSRMHSPRMQAFAEDLFRKGGNLDEIHRMTGMWQGAGGHWYSEISDHNARVDTSKIFTPGPISEKLRRGQGVPLSEILTHPELDKAYPGLADKIHVRIKPTLRGGYYDGDTGNITMGSPLNFPESGVDTFRKVLLHEVNHAIAHYEGFPRGASPQKYVQELNDKVRNLDNQLTYTEYAMREAKREGNDRYYTTLAQERDGLQKTLDSLSKPGVIEKIARDKYNRSAGENMSVETQKRADLTPEERRRTPIQQQRPTAWQIVDYNPEPSPHREGVSPLHTGEGISAHEIPIADSLKKTGEMDEEGRLHGMILDEDKLPNEGDIVSQARQGDSRSINQLFNKYYPRLQRTMRSYMRDAGPRLGIDSEDIATEAFRKAFANLDSFKGDSSFYTWLHNIARNEALNEITRSGRQVPTETMYNPSVGGGGDKTAGVTGRESMDASGNPIRPSVEAASATKHTPEEEAFAQQTSNMVRHAISRLPPEIREAIKLRELEGLSEQEIAEQQGIPVGTVKSRLARGRDMIKNSIQRGHGAQYLRQGGFINPDLLKRWTLALTGTALGAAIAGKEHSLKGAIEGFILGVAAGNLTAAGFSGWLRAMRTADTYRGASVVLDGMESSIQIEQRHLNYLISRVNQQVPDIARRQAISHYLEGDKSVQLSPQEKAIAGDIRSYLNKVGLHALTVGVVKSLLPDYITHIFSKNAKTQAALNAYQVAQMTSAKQSSVFGRTRKGPATLAEAQAHGMDVETDISKILQRYGTDMYHAIYGKSAIDLMKKMAINGDRLILPAKGAPMSYVGNDHPALSGLKVHPAIATEVSHLFDIYRPGIIGGAYDALSSAVRRVKLSYSLFHAKTLFDISQGVHTNPLKNLKDSYKSARGITEAHKEIASPVRGDLTDKRIAAGLTGEFGQGSPGNVDITGPIEETLRNLGESLDKMLPGLSKITTNPLIRIDNVTQKVTWNNMWTGLKASAEDTFFHQLKRNNARAASLNPSHKMPTDAELHTMASSVSNKLFGGLNYRRIANEVSNKYLRQIIMSATSPAGMRFFRRSMLAPDFTFATTSHILGMFGEGTGIRGLLHPMTKADLHRGWFIRSSLYYLILGNALNVAMSGKYLWQNKDPFMIDMGDGRKMQWSKAITDPFRSAVHPGQEILNKTNPLIQEGLEQILNQQYLRAGGEAPPITKKGESYAKTHLQHLAGLATPIPVSTSGDTLGSKALGFFGSAVYGKSHEKKMTEYERRMSKLQEGK